MAFVEASFAPIPQSEVDPCACSVLVWPAAPPPHTFSRLESESPAAPGTKRTARGAPTSRGAPAPPPASARLPISPTCTLSPPLHFCARPIETHPERGHADAR